MREFVRGHVYDLTIQRHREESPTTLHRARYVDRWEARYEEGESVVSGVAFSHDGTPVLLTDSEIIEFDESI